jgi:carboxyl-terminal processing protease
MVGVPMVVLLDGRSASGAEVVAGALQDVGRAVVVGASSFGKGSVQTVTRLPNDGELFLTWSRIFVPSGYSFHEQGVLPSICTSTGIGNAAAIVEAFRSGRLEAPAQLHGMREVAHVDPQARAILREACPWQEHDAQLDVDVALALLSDPGLYQQALSAAIVAPGLAQR